MYYTWKEIDNKYNWNIGYRKEEEKIKCAKARGVIIEPRGKKKNEWVYEIIEEYNIYTRQDIIDSFELTPSNSTKAANDFIKYCKYRGIQIEKVGLLNKENVYRILDDKNYLLENEIWKPVPNTSLFASNLGRIKNNNGRLKTLREIQGYLYVTDGVYEKTWRVHRLVLLAFSPIENHNEFAVDHINGIKTDNRIDNLRWVTAQKNISLRDESQNKIGALVSELIQNYGYEEIYNYLVAKRKKKGE